VQGKLNRLKRKLGHVVRLQWKWCSGKILSTYTGSPSGEVGISTGVNVSINNYLNVYNILYINMFLFLRKVLNWYIHWLSLGDPQNNNNNHDRLPTATIIII
jgi:hypothetical protein